MKVTVLKGQARGQVTAPPSKSMAHRLLMAAGLSEGKSTVSGVDFSQDISATLDCLETLGASYEIKGNAVTFYGMKKPKSGAFFCRESGSTLRFFIPLALLSEEKSTFTGTEKLLSRPLSVYEKLCGEKGLFYSHEKNQVTVSGPLQAGDFTLPADVSSQFITGLLFALPLLKGDSRLHLTGTVESRSYINLTVQALKDFSVQVLWEDDSTLFIGGNQRYQGRDISVEGDYSNAAFFSALALLGNDVKVTGLRENSLQGDQVYEAYFPLLKEGTPTLDIRDCPDLGPILFTLAAVFNGAVFTGTRRLRIKESNRAQAMKEELEKLGACITVEENQVIVEKAPLHAPNEILKGHNDHRVVMSLTVLLTLFGGSIQGAEAVRKSFPHFFEEMEKIGICVQREEETV